MPSRSSRRVVSPSRAPGNTVLTATRSPVVVSVAAYTSPSPPLPSSASNRNRPCTVPASAPTIAPAYRARARYDGIRVGTPATKAAPKRLTGAKVGKYTLKDLLGQGAYGEVYAAEQKDGPNVAVKILDATHARDADAVARVKREDETAQRPRHP